MATLTNGQTAAATLQNQGNCSSNNNKNNNKSSNSNGSSNNRNNDNDNNISSSSNNNISDNNNNNNNNNNSISDNDNNNNNNNNNSSQNNSSNNSSNNNNSHNTNSNNEDNDVQGGSEPSASKTPKLPKSQKPLTGLAAKRVMKEYSECIKISFSPEPTFTVELIDNCISKWKIELYAIDTESRLYSGMIDQGIASITLHMSFPDDYPFSPPFLNVVKPRIRNGYVFSGGAICMELLTKEAWCSAYSAEAVLMQFASQVAKKGEVVVGEGPYNTADAHVTFRRLLEFHKKKGWRSAPMAEG